MSQNQVLERVLGAARQLGASDVHLKAGLPPIFRIKGELRTVRDVPALSREAIATFAVHMMSDKQRAEFEETLDVAVAFHDPILVVCAIEVTRTARLPRSGPARAPVASRIGRASPRVRVSAPGPRTA